MLVIAEAHQGKGLKRLVTYWEQQQSSWPRSCLTSTQVDEQAQHFYRKLGYQDAGGLLLTSSDLNSRWNCSLSNSCDVSASLWYIDRRTKIGAFKMSFLENRFQ